DYAEAHANLANLLSGMPDRLQVALGHYEEALRIDPNVAWVHLALALQLSAIPGRDADAISHAEAALRLHPDYPEAYNCLGIVYAQEGRLDAARENWERALQIKPDYETARENLAMLERMLRARAPSR
ncbi:MAG: tetratricopeptide repeat protein, partial [Opitutaceae bacterium]